MFDPNTKFLVVDDSTTTRKMNKNSLAEIGFKNVVEAADGVEAFQMLLDLSQSPEPIDFIVSDWNMPNMHGIDFLRKCRAQDQFKKTPFIFITVESEPAQILEAGSAGVTEYLVKPYNSDVLKMKIENVYCKINNLPMPSRK